MLRILGAIAKLAELALPFLERWLIYRAGKSAQEKETTVKVVSEVEKARNVESRIDALSDAERRKLLLDKWTR